ncbi:MAG: bifunctional isocitrate dehydrogenase kinase/phosphatase [Bacteroidia bacterium]
MAGFASYLAEFHEVTARARTRFENRDWHGIQADSKKRLSIYKRLIPRIARQVKRMAADADRAYWLEVKNHYADLALRHPAYEIAETFYNSVFRKVAGDIGADMDLMFVRDAHETRPPSLSTDFYRTYAWDSPGTAVVRQILDDYRFQTPYEDLDRDVSYIADRLEQEVFFVYPPGPDTRIDIFRAVFFRNKSAYIVGRLAVGGTYLPFVLPMLHGPDGIFADALITNQDEMSIIFSFTRSYFLVEVGIPSEWVQFLQSILPLKPASDLYNSIGFNKHGKTELYRDFIRHLDQSDDKIVVAPGIRGMVMAVFTLASYNIVFKLIKDKFDPPKHTNKAHVRSRYKLVSMHDRVGRMADTHEFEFFEFPLDRFDPALLDELLRVAPSIVHVRGDRVVIDHLYTERKMVPLNIFLETAAPEAAEEVIDEYGNTIKQLAAANIFPGDMLLKNFGVTRHRRVVFYDYDEIGFLTDYNFRRIPEPSSDDDMFAGTPWFAVGPNDVFPEEFKHFLVGREDIRGIFFELHADLFDPRFWIDMQEKQLRGEIVDVFPYRRRRRFSHQSPDRPGGAGG